eukprot:2825029-Amphidinium_carterae.1
MINWKIYDEAYEHIFDEITGRRLDPKLVAAARKEEMEFLRQLQAYSYDSTEVCWEKTGRRPVPVKWVNVDKGEPDCPKTRARLVVQETRYHSTITDEAQ